MKRLMVAFYEDDGGKPGRRVDPLAEVRRLWRVVVHGESVRATLLDRVKGAGDE